MVTCASISARSRPAKTFATPGQPRQTPHRLDEDDFPLTFRFAAAAFGWPDGYALSLPSAALAAGMVGVEKHDARQEFTHLPPGSYRFEVQARDALGRLATTRGFEFEVPPPWYRSAWVTGSAALALIGMIPVLLWLGGHRQARRNARLEALVAQRTGELQGQKRLLQQERDRFDHLSRHDELTGLPNRRHGKEQLERAWRAALDGGQFVSLALIDIDHFKRINDRHGHDSGDRVLVEMAELLHSSSRPDDVVVRWGGEEFLLLFPGTGLPDAVAICHRICDLVRAHDWGASGDENGVSISVGVTATRGRRSVAELLSRADELLYQAKRNGRDRVEVERENW
jgi:diguanylate cyclase (GGDEF)-like protein